MADKHDVWLSLGSNIGDRLAALAGGLRYLLDHGLELVDCSGVYETEPVGYEEQPDFYNMVVRAATDLAPLELLGICREAEEEQRRERTIRWGPRTLDVDILLYDDLVMDTQELTLPHPRMGERAFVLGPLGDMDPGLLNKLGLPHLIKGIVLQIPAADVRMMIAGT
ncbi:MAG: 2-amino-4-hydroxy-6-hydroxymethyldihydropteridine diphosphokinase [Clostridiales bacterium]|nr:2-amino-4-hydroxy-6-hydroxymethyldihydropteridine diphosphokinase [Clostridiales bacterium]